VITELKEHYTDVFIFTCQSSIDNYFNVLGSDIAAEILNNCGSIVVDPVTPDTFIARNIPSKKISINYTVNNIQDIFSKLV
jgi:hypothetical protein